MTSAEMLKMNEEFEMHEHDQIWQGPHHVSLMTTPGQNTTWLGISHILEGDEPPVGVDLTLESLLKLQTALGKHIEIALTGYVDRLKGEHS